MFLNQILAEMQKFIYRPIILSLLIAIGLISCKTINIDNPEISIAELSSHIEYLASDSLEGRYPGTDGDLLAANYIAKQFKDFGLENLTKNYLQNFEIVTSVKAGESNSFIYNNDTAVLNTDFTPLSFSENTSLRAEVCFAGYGFNIDSDNIKWNDYDGIDFEGKWLMLLRGEPEIDSLESPYMKFSSDRDKVMLAKDMGAAGVLLVSGPGFSARDNLDEPSKMVGSTGMPVFQISRKLANTFFEGTDYTIEKLEETLNSERKPLSFAMDMTIEAISNIEQEKTNTYNVVGFLEGNDPILKNEYIVIGGHYDHLGWGGEGSSSRMQDTLAVHYGADDNASGIAAVIEIAEKFAASKKELKRSVFFVAFGAEEMGLLGSKFFVDEKMIAPENISIMLNMDMIGRLSADNDLEISGAGTAKELKDLLKKDSMDLQLALSDEGYGPSDHASFYGTDVPVLHISTGAHLDYHTPFDTFDKLNMEGLKLVADFVFTLANKVNGLDYKLSFTEAGPKTGNVSRKRMGVTLGIMPDFAGKVKNGLRADFVIEGKPAYKGGMKKGDIITAINGKSINNIQDYMYRLSKLKFGQTISVEVIRGEKKEILLIQL